MNRNVIRLICCALIAAGIILSRWIEPGVRVETVTLAVDSPALQFQPADAGPHSVALLAHGITASKESLFRFGEALAAAGFVCFAVDHPGHGASKRPFSSGATVDALEQVARSLGTVDVFLGHSMGAAAGAAAVRSATFRPRLFIAVGANPDLGTSGPPLLLLAGRFEELVPPNALAERTEARLVLSPWSDHALEPFDPRLVCAAVDAACATMGRPSPTPPTRWRWRLAGLLLGQVGALGLLFYLPSIPRPVSWARGPLMSAIVIITFVLTATTWLGAVPQLRRVPVQLAGMALIWLALAGAARLRLPRWSLVALDVVLALLCLAASRMLPAQHGFFIFLAFIFSLNLLILGSATVLAAIAARGGRPRDGDLAMAVFIGYAIGQWVPL
jgi:pimeloyl-ACP methyl ester carboxylesterase